MRRRRRERERESSARSSMDETLPPGFRFHPTDEELITYYLTNKVSDFDFTTKAVADVDLNKNEPWDLPGKASMGEKEWYFFSLRDRKYPTGLRTNRATEAGYWKTTGKDKEIFRGGSNVCVGMKKTLVFYRGRAPKGEKTNWVMHEYRLQNNHLTNLIRPTKEEWVVCRVFQKSSTIKRFQQTVSVSGGDESPTCDTSAIGGDMELPNFNMGFHNYNINGNSDPNMMMMMMNNINNAAGTEAPPPPPPAWPFLASNLSMNSLLLTALHLRRGATPIADNTFTPQLENIGPLLYNDFSMLQPPASTSGVVIDAAIPHQPPPGAYW